MPFTRFTGLRDDWHEDPLIVQVLQKEPLMRDTLWERVHRRQAKELSKVGFAPHSKSNFNTRVKILRDSRIIEFVGDLIKLTEIGHWVAASKPLDIPVKLSFLENWVCSGCTGTNLLVLVSPLTDTANTNAKGSTKVAGSCPCCNQIVEFLSTPNNMTLDEFVEFYNQAIVSLATLVNATVEPVMKYGKSWDSTE